MNLKACKHKRKRYFILICYMKLFVTVRSSTSMINMRMDCESLAYLDTSISLWKCERRLRFEILNFEFSMKRIEQK